MIRKISKSRTPNPLGSGVCQNLQVLGRQLGESKERILSQSSVSKTANDVLDREGDIHFRDYLGMLQSTEINVIKTMAVHGVSNPKEISDASGMNLNEVTALLGMLLDKGVLQKTGRGQYKFTDNMFKTWLSTHTQS
ncbi:MAG: hypothetical protein QXE82_05410 [Candidatus Nitrosotenuis sp.]